MMQAIAKVLLLITERNPNKDVTSHLFPCSPFPSSCSLHPYKPHSVQAR